MKKISTDLESLLEQLRQKINETYHAASDANDMLTEEMGESANTDFLSDIVNSMEHSAQILESKLNKRSFNKE